MHGPKNKILNGFSKNTQIPNLMKIRAVGAKSLHTDGEMDRTKPTLAFRNFANPLKNRYIYHCRFV